MKKIFGEKLEVDVCQVIFSITYVLSIREINVRQSFNLREKNCSQNFYDNIRFYLDRKHFLARSINSQSDFILCSKIIKRDLRSIQKLLKNFFGLKIFWAQTKNFKDAGLWANNIFLWDSNWITFWVNFINYKIPFEEKSDQDFDLQVQP